MAAALDYSWAVMGSASGSENKQLKANKVVTKQVTNEAQLCAFRHRRFTRRVACSLACWSNFLWALVIASFDSGCHSIPDMNSQCVDQK
eukprot:5945994-Amphidinium_carterae.1